MPAFRKLPKTNVLAVFLGMMLLYAGETEGAAGLPMKACQLITPRDVQNVLGGGFTAQEMPDTEIQSMCGYKQQGGDTVVIISLSRTIYESPQYLRMEQEGMKQSAGQMKVTPVSGVGEGAFYFVAAGQNGPTFQLHFGKGTLQVILDVETNRKPNIDAALKLARIAYPKIP